MSTTSSLIGGPKFAMFLNLAFILCAMLPSLKALLPVVPVNYYFNRAQQQRYLPYPKQQYNPYKPYKKTYEAETKADPWSNRPETQQQPLVQPADPWAIKNTQQGQQGNFLPVAQTDWTRQPYNPSNVHNMYYTSYDDCDPWCRAHCATKRTPDFCYLAGPCMNNCYRIVTNFRRARM